MRKSAFTLLLLACSLALAQTVYKWVDENGVVHYSDQPHAKAEKIRVPAAQTYKALPTDSAAASAGGAAESQANASPYQGCAIVQPSSDQTLANIDAVTIVVQTDPQLRSGDRIYITLDGQPLNGGAPTGSTFTVSPVERGAHTLQAVVRDGQGATVCQPAGVTFDVHQNSILNSANPNNVRPAPAPR
jgi:Domain of unknown function (DUF4124)